jgi:hypothetical protein
LQVPGLLDARGVTVKAVKNCGTSEEFFEAEQGVAAEWEYVHKLLNKLLKKIHFKGKYHAKNS